MVATAQPNQPSGSLPKVTRHPHTSLMTTKFGEDFHQHHFTRTFVEAIKQALSQAEPST
jgi:hypothetical protein